MTIWESSMFLINTFRKWAQRRSQPTVKSMPKGRRRSGFRPRLEALEDRTVFNTDITIVAGAMGTSTGGTFNVSGVFTPSADTASIANGDIQSFLNAGTSVTISTHSAFASTGSITEGATATITKSAGGNATLSLTADTSIAISQAISSSTGQLAVTLDSGTTDTISAAISANGGAVNLTDGGALSESGGGLVSTTGTLTTSSVGGTTLGGANAVGTFNGSNTTSGGISLTNTATTLALTGLSNTSTDGNGISVFNTGGITTSGLIQAGSGAPIGISATGAITVGANVHTSGTGSIAFSTSGADALFTLSAGTISDTAGVNVTADKMSLGAGTGSINAGSGGISLSPNRGTQVANLVGAVKPNAAGALELNQADLNVLTTSGGLTIGAANNETGAITLSAPITSTGTGLTGALNLTNNTGGIAINNTLTWGAAVDLTANQGSATTGAITEGVNGAITTTTGLATNSATGTTLGGSNQVGSFSATNTTSGSITLNNTATTLTVTGIAQDATTASANIGVTNSGNLTTTGSVITVVGSAGTVTLAANSGTSLLTIGPTITSDGNVSLTGAGGIDFSGTVRTTNATAANAGVSFNSQVTLTGSAQVTTSAGGAISFGSTVNGRFDLTTDSSGMTTFTGAVGPGVNGALTTLTTVTETGGTTTIEGGAVTTTGHQTFNNPVTITADTTFTDSGTGIFFNSTVDGDGNGPWNLTAVTTVAAAQIQLNKTVGGVNPLKSLTVNDAGPGSATGVIHDSSAVLTNFIKQGAGTFTLAGTNTYRGVTTISGGVLQVSADAALGAVPAVETTNVFLNGGTLRWGASFDLNANRDISLGDSGGTIDTNGFSTAVASQVAGTGSLTKVGAGTLTLTNTNSYADTTINGGTLLVASTGSMSAARTVTVNSSAILSGSGSVGYIDAVGGTVDVGTAILTATSADFSLGGNLQVEIGGYSTGNYGQLNLSGNLALGSSSSLTVDVTGLTAPGTAVGVVTYGSHSGPTAFATTNVINNPDNFQATSAAGATGLNVTLSVPGPVLTSLATNLAPEGNAGYNLTVTGSGFVSGSVVQWNGTALATTFVSGTQLSAAIPATYLAEEGTATITVVNPDPSGGTSSGLTFTINDAALSAAAVAISPVARAPFSGAVVTFSDADPNGTASDYSATIDWGNGATSAGTIAPNGMGGFTVSGSTTYAAAGPYTIHVSIKDAGGATTTLDSPMTVADLGIGVQRGQSAGIGFWQNKNGQALINSFNGGPTSTALSTWLAATLPNLYGTNAGSHNLTGLTNAQVAGFYVSLFNQKGPKLDAQVLDTALDVYATTLSLGGTAAQAYGFDVTAYGLGASDYNVGANGAAFGVANDTTLTVLAPLKDADSLAVNGMLYNGDLTPRREALNVFNGINSLGGL
jgi:hypothetical protein